MTEAASTEESSIVNTFGSLSLGRLSRRDSYQKSSATNIFKPLTTYNRDEANKSTVANQQSSSFLPICPTKQRSMSLSLNRDRRQSRFKPYPQVKVKRPLSLRNKSVGSAYSESVSVKDLSDRRLFQLEMDDDCPILRLHLDKVTTGYPVNPVRTRKPTARTCSAEARRGPDPDCLSVNELAAYMDHYFYLPRTMSAMAESMYN